jgi:Protein of unknown function (DUF2934)
MATPRKPTAKKNSTKKIVAKLTKNLTKKVTKKASKKAAGKSVKATAKKSVAQVKRNIVAPVKNNLPIKPTTSKIKTRKSASPMVSVMNAKSHRPQISPEERLKMIAEEAYYLAEKRGFSQGNEVADWVAAEQLVDQKVSSR